eukprot:gene5176-21951_t
MSDCVGMRLCEVEGKKVCSPDDFRRLLVDELSAQLRFRPG